MANVRLNLRDCQDGGLPPVCMQCGERATTLSDQEFLWFPKWPIPLLILGIIPAIIAMIVLTRRRKVRVPFCDAHRNHWKKRFGLGLGFLFGPVGLFTLLYGGARLLDPRGDTAGPILSFTFLIVLVTMIVALTLIVTSQIAPVAMTGETITLNNVSPGFIEALDKLRNETLRVYEEAGGEERWRERDKDRDRANTPRPQEIQDRNHHLPSDGNTDDFSQRPRART
jgi:hypothetical protein